MVYPWGVENRQILAMGNSAHLRITITLEVVP